MGRARRTTDATDEDDDGADQRGTDWVAEDCDDDEPMEAYSRPFPQ